MLTEQSDVAAIGGGLDGCAVTGRAVRVQGDLTLALAPALCRAVRDALREETDAITIDLRAAKTADVVGLATLLQCGVAAERAGAELSVVAEEPLRDAVLAARLLEEIPFVTGVTACEESTRIVEAPRLSDATPLLTRSARIGLRQPTWDELALFGRWAADRCSTDGRQRSALSLSPPRPLAPRRRDRDPDVTDAR